MLNIVICEDIETHRLNIKMIIENVILIEEYKMKVCLETDNPNDVVEYVKATRSTGIYFLDVDLHKDINGIELAEIIRKYDPRGYVVIITAYPGTMPLVFKYQIEVMDFINKNEYYDFRERIEKCIRNAYVKHISHSKVNPQILSIKLKDQLIILKFEDIVSIETSKLDNHKTILHTLDTRHEFYSSMREIEHRLDDRFYRLSQSYIINLNHVKTVDIVNKKIYMSNGMSFLVPSKRMMDFKKRLKNN